MREEAEPRYGSEAPTASATQSPEEVRGLNGVTGDHLARCEHDVCRLKIVTGEAVLSPEHAEAAAKGESGDPYTRA